MRDYATPSITDAGSVADVTAASYTGGYLDGVYPVGTPLTDPIQGPLQPPAPFS